MNEREIFIAALQIKDPADRQAYLADTCGADSALRQHIEGLLQTFESAGSFLDMPAAADATAGFTAALAENPPATSAEERVGTMVGPYKLLEPIGEGGMGTVWMAQQSEPIKRLVAIKLIKAGMDSKQVLARFDAERQALALMDHPNIAKVFDAGTTGEPAAQARDSTQTLACAASSQRPFFVMELVKGVPITKYCDDHHLTPRQRLELFIPVCQAIQHAHQKGIIHRDIKPSNVLVAMYDDRPVPKVIDFGVAKATGQQLTEATLHTGFGAVVGTIEYMSPEQASFNQLDVDTRSDIYSLGVLLYELLAGSTPFTKKDLEKAGMMEMLRVIREQEPSKPSTKLSSSDALPSLSANRSTEPSRLAKLVRGELDWIVMRALEKDRSRRYETANGFAMDVQRYLADEAVQACPPSAGYRLRKFARRNKGGLAVAALVLFFLVLLGSGAGWAMRDREAREQEIALETGRKLALTEEGIRQALDRGTKSRAELHVTLKKPGGVQQLLNQPARWELLIKTAQGELAQARRLLVRAEGSLDVELTQAMDKFEQQLTSDQDDYDLALRLEKIRLDYATLAEREFDYTKAADEYSKAFARFAMLNDDPAAVADWIASSPIKDQLVAALDDWARVASILRKRDLAEQLLALAREAVPDPAWGDRLRQLKVWRDKEVLAKLVAQAPATGLSPQLLARVGSLLRGDTRLVEAWLRQAQAEHPTDFWLNFDLANALWKTQPLEAAGFYRVALAVRPESSAAYNGLGIALYGQKKLPEAIAAYRKAIEIDPKHANALISLGAALNKQNKLDEAIECFRTAINLEPNNAHAYGNLGVVLLRQGKLDEAVAACRKAIELDPKYAPASRNLSFTLGKKALQFREMKNAAGCLAVAAEYETLKLTDTADKLYNAACIRALCASTILEDPKTPAADAARLANEQADLAMAWLHKAVAAGYKSAQHMKQDKDLDALREREDFKKLVAALARAGVASAEKALAEAPKDANRWHDVGTRRYDAGDFEGAVTAFQKYHEMTKGEQEWTNAFRLAMAHWRLGNTDLAKQWYDKGVQWMDMISGRATPTMIRIRNEAAELLKTEAPPRKQELKK